MSTATAPEPLMTAEQFGKRPDPGYPEELVRGRVVSISPPFRRHGQVCSKADRIIGSYVENLDLGHVLTNDSGVITERNPDTVRGADVAFYSFDRLPRGALPASYGPELPELVIEVLSPSDRWPRVLAKVAEYLEAGVTFVVVLDDEHRQTHVYAADEPVRVLNSDSELALPDVLGEFRVRVAKFFE
jgi:Uma2 family endonuclease